MSGLTLKLVENYVVQSDQKVMVLLASDGEREILIETLADADGTFPPSTVSAMLRNFADFIDRKFERQVAA